jgi:hypothetical protein
MQEKVEKIEKRVDESTAQINQLQVQMDKLHDMHGGIQTALQAILVASHMTDDERKAAAAVPAIKEHATARQTLRALEPMPESETKPEHMLDTQGSMPEPELEQLQRQPDPELEPHPHIASESARPELATCLDREYVQKEIRWARKHKKNIITLYESERHRPGYFDYAKAMEKYRGTEWEHVLRIDSIKYQREQFLAEAMLQNILAKANSDGI